MRKNLSAMTHRQASAKMEFFHIVHIGADMEGSQGSNMVLYGMARFL
jgi:hypothetical protein